MKKKTLGFMGGFLGAFLFALPALAAGVQVEAAYAYPTADTGNNSTLVAMTLNNTSKQKDRLIGAVSPIAESTTVFDRGASTAIAIPAGKRVALTPQGSHIMINGLKKPLTPGAMVPLTLTFEKTGPVSIEVPVKDMGAR